MLLSYGVFLLQINKSYIHPAMDEIVITFASSKVDRMFFLPTEICNIFHLIKLPIEMIQI